MSTIQKPSIGRIVEIAHKGRVVAAVVTAVWDDGRINAKTFRDGHNDDDGVPHYYTIDYCGKPEIYADTTATWRYPPRCDETLEVDDESGGIKGGV